MSGNLKNLDTGKMDEAIIDFRSKIEEFQNIRNRVEKITNDLLLTWIGESSKAYEVQYNVLNRSLKDIEDSLYDMNDVLVEAAAEYIETDDKLAKALEAK